MAVTDEEILWAYRIVLGREPESQSSYDANRQCADLFSLCTALFDSAEFARNNIYNSTISVKRKPYGTLAADNDFVRHFEKRVLVVSGCQAEPIAKNLQALTGADCHSQFISEQTLEAILAGKKELPQEWQSFDLILTQKRELFDKIQFERPTEFSRWQLLPLVLFDGFHPDQCYLYRSSDGTEIIGPMGVYHSKIITAAYFSGISAADTADLFDRKVFKDLGYHERFDAACSKLVFESSTTAVPLENLIKKWNKNGKWMLSVNHPCTAVIEDIVKNYLFNMAIKFENRSHVYVRDDLIELGDWPSYFEGEKTLDLDDYRFRVPSSLSPDHRGTFFLDLYNYILLSYSALSHITYAEIEADDLNGSVNLKEIAATLRRNIYKKG